MLERDLFKIGYFAYGHDSASTMSVAPERWRARWDDIERLAREADEGGLDFLLTLARWKGWRKGHGQNWNFDNLTTAAALATITKRIALISTLHTPVIHPVMAAKMLATIDHASHGRAGVNIVAGWNKNDFEMFGLKVSDHDQRYKQGEEWLHILKRIIAGTEDEFDYDSPNFPNLKGLMGLPGSIQQPGPVTINAAISDQGKDFAIRNVDYILLGSFDEKGVSTEYRDDIHERSRRLGRKDPPQLLAMLAPYIRESRKEAEDFYRYFAIENEDTETLDNYVGLRTKHATTGGDGTDNSLRRGAAAGGRAVVGTPEDFVDTLVRLKKQGYAGATMTPPNFLEDLPIIVNRVLPLMKEAGLR
ncbi:hypothetical protein A8G00_21190 [Sphingobium sp. SA916]|nr:hypothetical protein A8G00_21190 [Sphingobium sp. SA916]